MTIWVIMGLSLLGIALLLTLWFWAWIRWIETMDPVELLCDSYPWNMLDKRPLWGTRKRVYIEPKTICTADPKRSTTCCEACGGIFKDCCPKWAEYIKEKK